MITLLFYFVFYFFSILGDCSCENVTIGGFGPLCQKTITRQYTEMPICWVNEPTTCVDATYIYGVANVKKRFSADACKGRYF